MDVIDLTSDDSPPPPPPAIHSEPIGVHVSVDILDLTEGQSDNEEEMHSVPQHLDWNDIAEQRAAHAAFQALRSNPHVAPPPQPLVRRQRPPIQRGNNHKKRPKNKGKRKQSQQSAGESSSSQQKKKKMKKSCDQLHADGDARKKNNGQKQAAKKHPNKRRDQLSNKAKQAPKNAPEQIDGKDTEAAAMRKREQKRRKNQRRRRNLAARKRAKEEAKREESETKIANNVESQSGSFGAKTSESNDKSAREPSAVHDEKPSAVRSETQQPPESTLSIGILEESSEKSESVAKNSAPKPPPAVSHLNVSDLTARDRCPRDVQPLENQQHQGSEISSQSCVNTVVKSDTGTVMKTARESVREPPSSMSHVAAEKHSPDLCEHIQPENQRQENSVDSPGANVSTAFTKDAIASHIDDADSETETDVDSQSGKSSNSDRKETVPSSIGENDGSKKSVRAEVDHIIRESSDPDEPQTLPVQKAAPPREESQTEQSVKKSIDASDEKHDQLEHDHVSLSPKRDKRCGGGESSVKNASTSLRTGEESPCKKNETIGRRQDSGHGTTSTTTPYTNPQVIVIDGVENEKEQNEFKVPVQPSKPASGEKSALPAKRQSQTASSSRPVAAGMNDSPTMKNLIDANAGARDKKRAKPKNHSGTKKQGERKSWQSTVIIVETSDEEESDSDGPEVEFLKTSPPAKKRKRGRPTNPATKFKKYPPKREPLEQHLRTNGQYNFHYTEEEAAKEQERLFKQAADRLRQNASMANQASGTASVPRGTNDLSHDHWRSPDLYHRLGLPPGAPIQHVKRQYRRLALRYHPDKGWKDVHTTDRFQAITEAYKVLCGECERL